MAENDVYISGIDPSIPGWATENTMASIRQILASMSANTDETNKALDKIYTGASGDAEKAFKVLHDTLGEVRQQGAKADKAICDAGLKAQSVDSGLPVIFGRTDVEYIKCTDEHGVIADPDGVLKVCLLYTSPSPRDRG